MDLDSLLSSDRFLQLVELRPPKGVVLDGLTDIVDRIEGAVDAFVVRDNADALMAACPVALGRRLIERGQDVVLHVSCRDRNRIALQSHLLGAYIEGVRSLLVTRGVDASFGDHPAATSVYDIEPLELMRAIQGLGEGLDMTGGPVEGEPHPQMSFGATINPFLEGEALRKELAYAEKQIAAGARFLLTNPVHDPEGATKKLARVSALGVPIIAQVMLLKSVAMARYINKNIAGDQVSKATIKRLRKAPDKGAESVQIACDTAEELRALCRGVCYQPLGWEERLPALLDREGK